MEFARRGYLACGVPLGWGFFAPLGATRATNGAKEQSL